MILSEVEETYLDEEIDKIANKNVFKVFKFFLYYQKFHSFLICSHKEKTRKTPMLYIRGDNIILFSPSLRSLN